MEVIAIITAIVALSTALINLTSALVNFKKRKDHRSGKR